MVIHRCSWVSFRFILGRQAGTHFTTDLEEDFSILNFEYIYRIYTSVALRIDPKNITKNHHFAIFGLAYYHYICGIPHFFDPEVFRAQSLHRLVCPWSYWVCIAAGCGTWGPGCHESGALMGFFWDLMGA